MGLKTIHGFLLQDQALNASWGVNIITETCLIEMDSPLEDINDVQNSLPAFDGVTAEPTFTIGLSHHPDRPDLLLRTAPRVSEHPEAGRPFWFVELVYETGQWLNDIFPGEDNGRGNVPRKFRPAVGTAATNEVIIYPWDEPPTWSSSTRRVKTKTYHDAAGNFLRHTNGLPLTEGFEIEIPLEEHRFTWNVQYDGFDYATMIAPLVGKLNGNTVFGLEAKHVFLEECTAVENYRAVSLATPAGQSTTGATDTHHFVTLNATFVLDRRTDSEHGYWREATRRVSMHTQQLQLVTTGLGPVLMYAPIPINDRGDVAESPWPLDQNGLAIPYEDLSTADPENDFGIIDPLYPLTANLTDFVTDNELVIP